jgi:hypothetical protein
VPANGRGRLAFGVPARLLPRIIIACIALGAICIQLIPLEYHWNVTLTSRSRGTPVELGSQPQLCTTLGKSNGILRISGNVTARTLANYPNVFATANPLEGVRLEIAPVGTVAAVFNSRKVGAIGVGGEGHIHAGQTWHFSLDIKAGGVITLDVAKMTTSDILEQLDLTCRSLLVGGGFDASRQLNGTVEPISFQAGTFTEPIPDAQLIGVLGVLLLLWVLAGTIGGRPPRATKDGTDD